MATVSPVDLCLKGLKHLLPKDTALQFLGRWYTLRNTPGGIGNQSEWHVFQRCLLNLMGYDTTRLALTSKVGSRFPAVGVGGRWGRWQFLCVSEKIVFMFVLGRTIGSLFFFLSMKNYFVLCLGVGG